MSGQDRDGAPRGPIKALRLHARHQTNEREPLVLVAQDEGCALGELCELLEPLGFQMRVSKNRADTQNLLEEVAKRTLVAVFPAGLALSDLDWLIASLADRPDGTPPIVLAAGPRPDTERRAQLRRRGVAHAIWEPYDDNRLRFVLNEAMGRHGRATQRSEPRVPTTFHATLGSGNRVKRASVYNLSVHGAYLEMTRPTMSGANVSLELQLPDGPLHTQACVAHTNVPGNLSFRSVPVGMGVRFSELTPDSLERLQKLVAERVTQLEV